MRTEVLSDHVGEQYERLTREIADNTARLAKHHDRLKQVKRDLRATRRRKGLLKRIFHIRTSEEREAQKIVEGVRHTIALSHQRHQELEQLRLKTAGGLKGEDSLRTRLSRLSDEWTYLAGYKNGAGEIDAVLIGPPGVWAVEVKSQRAHLHVDADEWWFDKYDRYGNVVETKWAVDGSGRNWGRQTSDPARRLESWLDRNGFQIRIRTAVVLINPRASLGRIRKQEIDLITCDPRDLVRGKRSKGRVLSETDRDAIAALIRRDHRHHRERRSKRRSTNRRRGSKKTSLAAFDARRQGSEGDRAEGQGQRGVVEPGAAGLTHHRIGAMLDEALLRQGSPARRPFVEARGAGRLPEDAFGQMQQFGHDLAA